MQTKGGVPIIRDVETGENPAPLHEISLAEVGVTRRASRPALRASLSLLVALLGELVEIRQYPAEEGYPKCSRNSDAMILVDDDDPRLG